MVIPAAVTYNKLGEEVSEKIISVEKVKSGETTYNSQKDEEYTDGGRGLQGIKIAVMPSVYTVGEEFFMDCTDLKRVVLGSNVTTIKSKAFADCTSLEKINLPASIEEIAFDAFDGCGRLTATVEAGSYAQEYCAKNNISYVLKGGDATTAGKTNARYKKAYADFLSNYYSVHGYTKQMFTIGYLDNDKIPELFLSLGDYHAAGVSIYTYKDGEVTMLRTVSGQEAFGSYGGLSYKEKTGYVISENSQMGCVRLDAYQLEEGQFVHKVSIYTYYDGYNDSDEPSVCEIDGETASWEAVKQMTEEYRHNTKTIEYGTSMELTKANIKKVFGVEGVGEGQASISSEYVFPDSDKEYLTKEELEGFSKAQLRIARNEIYARHGRIFASQDLSEYFNQKSWYTGYILPEDFNDDELNKYEKKNVKLISQVEKQ